jgi:hypothetical protein
MTSALAPWAYTPKDLRRIIDLEFVTGINRPVVHTSVHQPVDDKVPGLSLMIFGQFFNRHESWAEMARPGSITWRAMRCCCSRGATWPMSPISMARKPADRALWQGTGGRCAQGQRL